MSGISPRSVRLGRGMPRAADRAVRAQVLDQRLLQHAAGLDEQTAIDRLVRHPERLVLGVVELFSHPAICCGDQLRLSSLATTRRRCGCLASLHAFGRSARRQACRSEAAAR